MHCLRPRVLPALALFLLLTALVLGGGCSSFNHEWKMAAANPVPDTCLQGRWQGTWHSDASSHAGKLRCVITKTDVGMYQAHFHAKYRKVLGFGYTVALKVEPTVNGFAFSGQANLGRLAGGVYHYEGHADTTNFFSTYSCKYDHGTFQMARP